MPASVNSVNKLETLESFIADRKATKGLTVKGERWIRQTVGNFLRHLSVSLDSVDREHLVNYLGQWQEQPWQKHSMYRGLRTFWKWASMTYDVPNPMIDRWGNSVIDAPHTPVTILYTMTPVLALELIRAASCTRDKAIISLLADSGARQSEITSIDIAALNLDGYRIRVMGKGNKEGYLVFGENTRLLLFQFVNDNQPTGSLFGLNNEGLKTMLRRLESKTGIKCNSHSFRRGFATELRRKGLSELDIAELGRWSSTTMVKRYSRAYTFDDAAERYKPIVE